MGKNVAGDGSIALDLFLGFNRIKAMDCNRNLKGNGQVETNGWRFGFGVGGSVYGIMSFFFWFGY